MSVESFVYAGIALTIIVGLTAEYRSWKKKHAKDAKHQHPAD